MLSEEKSYLDKPFITSSFNKQHKIPLVLMLKRQWVLLKNFMKMVKLLI